MQRIFRSPSLADPDDVAILRSHPEVLVFPDSSLIAGRVRVAIDPDGRAVGFATLVTGAKAIELVDLFVEPARMRSGVGRALVIDLARFARAVGADRIDLIANRHALAFYEALGFLSDGEAPTEFGVGQRMHLDRESLQGLVART